jgi:hypothetical protein
VNESVHAIFVSSFATFRNHRKLPMSSTLSAIHEELPVKRAGADNATQWSLVAKLVCYVHAAMRQVNLEFIFLCSGFWVVT